MAHSRNPRLVIVAGPNGAGKSTTAPELLTGPLAVSEFVNADYIALGLSGIMPERAAMQAGRVMLKRLRSLADQRVDFAFETTLASRTFATWMSSLAEQGYVCCLLFLWLPNVESAMARVRERVALGGHHVPEETVIRRYRAGLRNFFSIYRPLCHIWRFYENASAEGPRLVAMGNGGENERVLDTDLWQTIWREVDDAEA